MSIETANALRAAKARIDTPGKWCKHQGDNGNGRCCAFGAAWSSSPALRALREALPEGNRSIAGYNDAPTTTHADIMALFDRAIAVEEETP